MLAFDSVARRAAANSAVSEGFRYAAQRLAELLDPTSDFIWSAAFIPDPDRTLAVLEEVGKEWVAGGSFPVRDEVAAATAFARDVLVEEPNVKRLYPKEYSAVLATTKTYRTDSDKPPAVVNKPALQTQMKDDVLPAIASLRLALASGTPTSGSYRHELVDLVLGDASGSLTSRRRWRKFDRNLAALAASLLGDGRHGRSLATAVSEVIAAAADSASAAATVKKVLSRPQRDFEVAMILEGARSFAPPPPLDCVVIEAGDGWPCATVGEESHQRLRDFARPFHQKDGVKVLVVATRAWDAGEARGNAAAVLEGIQDGLLASHRNGRFRLETHGLVLDLAADDTALLTDPRQATEAARVGPLPEALGSVLRYYALARVERVPLVAALHSFIAMEQLAVGAKRTKPTGATVSISKGAFLPPNVAAEVQLAGIRRLFFSAIPLLVTAAANHPERYRVASLLQWLGSSGTPTDVDLDRWGQVLEATPTAPAPPAITSASTAADVAAVVASVAANLSPFVRVRIELTRFHWSNRELLMSWARELGRRALLHTDHARIARNRTVHRGLRTMPGDRLLALNGCHLLDAVLEVLPPWLGSKSPWAAMADVTKERRKRLKNWLAGAPIVPSTIAKP